MDLVVFVLFITELLFIVLSYTLSSGNMLSPTFVSSIMFALATICILYNNDFWDVSYSWNTYYIILFTFCTMLIAEFTALLISYKKISKRKDVLEKNYYKKQDIYIRNDVNILLTVMVIVLTCFMIYDVFNTGGYEEHGLNAIGFTKYGEEGLSIISKLSLRITWIVLIVYLYVFIYNIYISKVKLKKCIKYIIPIIVGIINIFLSGNRVGFVKVLSIIYVFFMIFQRSNSLKGKVSFYNTVKKFLPIGLIVILAFYGLRGISKINSTAAQRNFSDYITYYVGSPLYLFDKWLNEYKPPFDTNYKFGQMSLTSIYKMFGVEVNYFNSYIYVGGESNFAGNEFSWFQRPYSDFGFFGMLLFTFIIYFIFSYILYYKISYSYNTKRRIHYIVFYAYYFYIIFMSFYYCQVCFAISIVNIISICLINYLMTKIIYKKH